MAEEISNNAPIVADMEPEEESLVLGADDPRDAALHEHSFLRSARGMAASSM